MPLFRTFRSLPELITLPKERQDEVLRDILGPDRTRNMHWDFLFYFLMFCSLPLGTPKGLGWFPGLPIAVIWGFFWVRVSKHHHISRLLPEIRKRVGYCMACGYGIHASSEKCPECGRAMYDHRPT